MPARGMIYRRMDRAAPFRAETSVADFLALDGTLVKQAANRRVVCFRRAGQDYFLKSHRPLGWREIIKSLVNLRRPTVSAHNEWVATQACEQIGIDTMQVVACGEQGRNPARRNSFLLSRALEHTETLEAWWRRERSGIRAQRAIIRRVAHIARTLHDHGWNHRDFYLCHFRIPTPPADAVDSQPRLYLMDLHRAQHRRRLPRRWRVKDLAALLFSALAAADGRAPTRRDCLCFMRAYGGTDRRTVWYEQADLWRAVMRRTRRLLTRYHPDRLPVFDRLLADARPDRSQHSPFPRHDWRRQVLGESAVVAAAEHCLRALAQQRASADQTMLKCDRRAVVASFMHDGTRYVAKYFPIAGLWERARQLPRRTRAERSWHNAHYLLRHDVATPAPIAAVVYGGAPLRHGSLYVSRFAEGPRCREFLNATDVRSEDAAACIDSLVELFARMRHARVSHGDMKDTNLILTDDRPTLLDVEGVCVHRSDLRLARAVDRDRQRLLRNWVDKPHLRRRFVARSRESAPT